MSSPQNLSKGKSTCGMRYIGAGAVGHILCLPHIFPYEPTSPHVPQGKFGIPEKTCTSYLEFRKLSLCLGELLGHVEIGGCLVGIYPTVSLTGG